MENRILTIQRERMPAYRIRLGDAQGGSPRRLVNEIRITSPNRGVVEAFAAEFGGRPKRWSPTRGRSEHEVYLPVGELPVELLPGQAVSQHFELWAGSVCQRRCDGLTQQAGDPCACGPELSVAERECSPVTRLNLVVPSVAVLGTGMLTTRSEIAAKTIPQAVDMADWALSKGHRVGATLRVQQATGVNRRYAYPVLDLDPPDVALAALMVDAPELEAGTNRLALEPAELVTASTEMMERAVALSKDEKQELNDQRKAAGLPSLTKPMTAEQLAAYGEILDSIAAVDGDVVE